jgi:mono/diheme cytochrome c family protein
MKRETVMLLVLLVAGDVVGAEADPRAALAAEAGVRHPEGAEIYRVRCASCHGEHGEGVADKYDEALYGERTVESLTRLIDRTMPEDAPEECVGEDAARVAAWVYEAFYSPAARERIDPPKLAFQHLTNEQLRKSMAALTPGVESGGGDEGRMGLRAVYWNDRDRKDDKKVLERVDAQVGFDWGEGSPLPDKIGVEAFAIGWSGSLRVPESGEYGFRVVTTNGVRLWVNAAGGGGRRGGEDAALIDGWVSSGNAARELTARMVLPGGSVVPVRLDFFKFKEKTARVRLEWQRPHGVWMPERRPRVVSVQAALPPDDGSAGYGRGMEVSREWHAAVTEAALEASAEVASELEGGAGGKVEGMM